MNNSTNNNSTNNNSNNNNSTNNNSDNDTIRLWLHHGEAQLAARGVNAQDADPHLHNA